MLAVLVLSSTSCLVGLLIWLSCCQQITLKNISKVTCKEAAVPPTLWNSGSFSIVECSCLENNVIFISIKLQFYSPFLNPLYTPILFLSLMPLKSHVKVKVRKGRGYGRLSMFVWYLLVFALVLCLFVVILHVYVLCLASYFGFVLSCCCYIWPLCPVRPLDD